MGIAEKPQEKKLLDQVRDAIRAKHYSLRTEKTYLDWIRRYILFHKKRHPREMGVTRPHHIHETTLQKAIRAATSLAKVNKRVTPHTLRRREAYL